MRFSSRLREYQAAALLPDINGTDRHAFIAAGLAAYSQFFASTEDLAGLLEALHFRLCGKQRRSTVLETLLDGGGPLPVVVEKLSKKGGGRRFRELEYIRRVALPSVDAAKVLTRLRAALRAELTNCRPKTVQPYNHPLRKSKAWRKLTKDPRWTAYIKLKHGAPVISDSALLGNQYSAVAGCPSIIDEVDGSPVALPQLIDRPKALAWVAATSRLGDVRRLLVSSYLLVFHGPAVARHLGVASPNQLPNHPLLAPSVSFMKKLSAV